MKVEHLVALQLHDISDIGKLIQEYFLPGESFLLVAQISHLVVPSLGWQWTKTIFIEQSLSPVLWFCQPNMDR